MVLKELKRSLSSMIRQREFYFALLFSSLILFLSLFISLLTFLHVDWIDIRPSWSYWGTKGTWFEWDDRVGSTEIHAQTMQFYVVFLLPFLSAMAYSYVHYDNCMERICNILIPREGRGSYYHANALAVFFSAFLIAAVSLILQQIVLLIALPFSLQENLGSTIFTDDYASVLLGLSGPLKGFQISHPYLFNLITALCIGITSGSAALCSFTFSLYFRKNRFLTVLLMPFLIFFIVPAFVKGIGGYTAKAFRAVSYASIGTSRNYDFLWWFIESASILAVNAIFIERKIHKSKDILI